MSKRAGKRRRKRSPRALKSGNVAALADLAQTEARAADYCIRIRVSKVLTRRRFTLHVMFEDTEMNRRLADYWPGNGTIRCLGENSKVPSLEAALDRAITVLHTIWERPVCQLDSELAAIIG